MTLWHELIRLQRLNKSKKQLLQNSLQMLQWRLFKYIKGSNDLYDRNWYDYFYSLTHLFWLEWLLEKGKVWKSFIFVMSVRKKWIKLSKFCFLLLILSRTFKYIRYDFKKQCKSRFLHCVISETSLGVSHHHRICKTMCRKFLSSVSQFLWYF